MLDKYVVSKSSVFGMVVAYPESLSFGHHFVVNLCLKGFLQCVGLLQLYVRESGVVVHEYCYEFVPLCGAYTFQMSN
jgi:hypothetical protein